MGLNEGDSGDSVEAERISEALDLGHSGGHKGGLLGAGGPTFLTTKVDFVVNWARRNSLWPMPFGTACCAIEMMASAASNFDLARFGMERMSFSPRQADVLICAGRVPYKLAPVLRRIWDQMMQPKWCVSMGACASSGGVFDTYSMVQGIDNILVACQNPYLGALIPMYGVFRTQLFVSWIRVLGYWISFDWVILLKHGISKFQA